MYVQIYVQGMPGEKQYGEKWENGDFRGQEE